MERKFSKHDIEVMEHLMNLTTRIDRVETSIVDFRSSNDRRLDQLFVAISAAGGVPGEATDTSLPIPGLSRSKAKLIAAITTSILGVVTLIYGALH